ncbi:MAG TPA: lasso peptide isopeptide bond-forming cyclase, partial [Rhodothermales bacterium]|nr:lasso peptide isopeptide bond-forming cyclase [Rhodothermales bacterium]
MSGITGLLFLDGRPVEADTLSGMTAALAHRGPDGSGRWVQGSAGLGHHMLWSTPESLTEKLPYEHAASGLVVTSDARIDNRDELLAQLGLDRRRERPIGDSEIIAAAYERWGEDCPDRLIGDFAFAIWDARRQGFFCARDCFGVKPIYYYHHRGHLFAFASEIKALLRLNEVPRRLNEARVADYLASVSDDKAATFYAGILRIPPAHCLWVDSEGLRIREYWRLDPSRELRLGSDEAYAETFREVFTEAVRCRVRSAFPVGSTVSGGLDSSSIACVASGMLNAPETPPFHTFSFVFDAVPESDERAYIEAALSVLSAEKHYVHPDRFGVFGDVERTLWHLDQPPFIRNLYLWKALYEDARKAGVRVLLDGEDGDTVISRGDATLYHIAMEGRWEEFERIIRSPQMQHYANYSVDPFYWLYKYGFPALQDQLRGRA